MGQSKVSLIMLVGFFALFYFMIIRPQKKREKTIKSMREALKVGDSVTTIGGLLGTITKIDGDFVHLELGTDRTNIILQKWGIGKINDDLATEEDVEVVESENEETPEQQ